MEQRIIESVDDTFRQASFKPEQVSVKLRKIVSIKI
jgi:hypothetical protein